MEPPAYRTTERVCVGLYALLVAGSVLTYAWFSRPRGPTTPGEPAPTVGVAFVVVGLFWLCILVATAMVCVLLVVNAARVRRGGGADRVVVALALAVPGGLLAALAVTVADPASGIPLLLAVVGLVVAPAGLLVATFGDRFRRGRGRTD